MNSKVKDIVVILITTTICLTMLIALISPLITGKPVTPEGREILGNVMMALIAILAYQLGQKDKD